MPFNGSGGTTQPASSLYPAVPSTLIQSAKANISIADIYTMLASCLLKDGQQVATQRIPFAVGISTDTVLEKTTDTGVTLDSVLLKDGRIDTAQGTDITCAATINLETATGNVVDVTGSTGPVTAITLSQGHWRIVRFTGTPTLTNGASLVLPGAANIVAAAGDYALFVGYAAGVVRVWYMRASGAAVITAPFSDATALVKGSADTTKLVRFEVDGLTTGTTRVLTVADQDSTIGKQPTQTQLTSGSGTYNTPAGCTRLEIEMVGGGAGGAGTTGAGDAGDSTFGTLTAAKGIGSTAGIGVGGKGTGGTATNGDVNITGGDGGTGSGAATVGGAGGSNPLGIGGVTTSPGGVNGNAATGYGAGGAGASQAGTASGGGGSGGYLRKRITAPAASYSYAVGAVGTAGTNGGAGKVGIIIIDEFYN